MTQVLAFVNVLKPAGPTSTQVTTQVRRIFSTWSGEKLAAGHLGTLDPAACGVLPIALGKATRLIPLIEDRRKVYVCTLVLGCATTTGDALGEKVRQSAVPADAGTLLAAVIPRFIGPIAQVPPMYSAVHHAGKRLYDLARAGISVERPSRTVTVHDLCVLGLQEGHSVRLRIVCGEGTYIRTLCEDLGNAIGVAAHMGSLVREASGPFSLGESLTLDAIAAAPADALLSPGHVIPLPTLLLDARGAADFRAGRVVAFAESGVATTSPMRVFVHDAWAGLIGVGERYGAHLAPRKVFS